MSGKRKTTPKPRAVLLPELKRNTALTPVPIKAQPSKRQKRKAAQIRGSEARTVRTRGRRIFTSLHPLSILDGKMLAGEASIERDYWVVVDFIYPTLVDAVAQPFTIPIEVFGQVHDWTPDALLTLADGTQILVETKPLKDLQPDPLGEVEVDVPHEEDPQAIARAYLDAWKAAAAERGLEFTAMTEAEIRKEPRFYNAKIMHRAMGSPFRDEVRELAVAALVAGNPSMTVSEFSEHLGIYRLSAMLVAAHLDREGMIRIDRTTFWSPRSRFDNLISLEGYGL